jgi:hypothetical protein
MAVASPADAAPTMSVTPSGNLVDGQTVTVTVTGLAPSSTAGVAQCVEGHGQEGCELDNRLIISTDENGGFTTTMVLHAILATPIGAIDCRTSAEACVVGANTDFSEVGAVWTITEFDPGGTLQPPPSLQVQPNTELLDNQLVTLVGAGYPVNIGYRVQICIGGSTAPTDCSSSQFMPPVFTGATGSFSTPLVVHSGLVTDGGTAVDCRAAAGTCEVRVGPNPLTNRTGVAPLDFDPAGPLTPQPTITVTPDDMLVDRQHVIVAGAEFAPQTAVQIRQCAVSGGVTCQTLGFASADGAGRFEAELALDARLWFGVDPAIDCRQVECQLRASTFTAPDEAVAAISFDPDGPLAPAPTVTAAPATNLVDHQIIDVTGTGFDFGLGFIGTPIPVRVDGEQAALPADVIIGVGDLALDAVMCAGSGTDFDRCSYSTFQRMPVDADGNLAGVFQVDAVLHAYEGDFDCRDATVACELRVGLVGHPFKQAALALAFDPEGALAPPPALTASPTTDLVDGQTVTVTGTGLPINRPAMVIQCATDKPFPDGCSGGISGGLVTTDGALQVDMAVRQVLDRGFGQVTDCATSPSACELAVIDQDFQPIEHIPLTFRAVVEPPPAPPGEDPPPGDDPPAGNDPTSTVTAVVLPATETRPSFTG